MVDKSWVSRVAEVIDIPFCVAGGIKSLEDAAKILSFGADKISINSPALADPTLITRLADRFGVQCIVVGIDTWYDAETGKYHVNQYTGDESRTRVTQWETLDWVEEVQKRGAGEIVLNMMNQDGVRNGYDLEQLKKVREVCHVPLIASGGAGTMEHFLEAFRDADVDGALAASVFHKQIINIGELTARYYYWTELERRRFDDVLKILADNEFFVEDRTISNALVAEDEFYNKLIRQRTTKRQLRRMFPGFDWG